MKPSVIPEHPPDVTAATIMRVPDRHRRDVVQDAWVAHLCGSDANVAVWKHFKRAVRREAKVTCFSQLEPDALSRIYRNENRLLGHGS